MEEVVVCYERVGHIARMTPRRSDRLNAIDAAANRGLAFLQRRTPQWGGA